MKICPGCNLEKPLEVFSRRASRCNSCRSTHNKQNTERAALERSGKLSEKQCWRCKLVKPIEEFSWRVDGKGFRRARQADCCACRAPYPCGTKRCGQCQNILPKTDFYCNGRAGACRICSPKVQRYYLLRSYGITVEQYDRLLEAQGGGCAICRTPPAEDDVLRVDHDHKHCGVKVLCGGTCVRGLLCDLCNRGIGMFKDDVLRLTSALKYVSGQRCFGGVIPPGGD